MNDSQVAITILYTLKNAAVRVLAVCSELERCETPISLAAIPLRGLRKIMKLPSHYDSLKLETHDEKNR